METNRKSFKKTFPNLSKEFSNDESKIPIKSVRTDPEVAEEAASSSDVFRNYNPTVKDFLRRCDTAAQAEEIISYMEKRGELTTECACELREQLRKEGVRSFGPKKGDNYYLKHGGLC